MSTHPDISACAHCLCDATRKAARAISAVYDRNLAPHGVRITQFTILANLELRGATSLGELAKILQLDRTTLTRNLEPLEAKTWVRSGPAPRDSRSRIVSVTNEGRAAVFAAFPAWREAQERVAALLSLGERALLKRLAHLRPPQ